MPSQVGACFVNIIIFERFEVYYTAGINESRDPHDALSFFALPLFREKKNHNKPPPASATDAPAPREPPEPRRVPARQRAPRRAKKGAARATPAPRQKGLPRDALPPQAAHHSDPSTMAPKDMKTCNACICCYQALDLADIKLLCVSEGEQCCIFSKTCLAAGEDVLGPGMIEVDKDKGEICNLGLVVCSYGLKTPAVCCKSRQSCLCLKSAAALPFDDEFVPGPVCAVYGCQCMPNGGCCTPPFSQKWLDDHKELDGVSGPAACEMTGR